MTTQQQRTPLSTPPGLRNIAVIAQAGAGKTTLIESMLYCSGMIRQKGDLEQGKATMQTEPEEAAHHMAVTIHCGHLTWKQHEVYFVDTPGSFNFLESTRGVLPGIDGAVFLFSATEGVKPESERLWRMLEEARIPVIGFLNQMDDGRANMNSVVTQIEQVLGCPVEPLAFPFRRGKDLAGVVDLLTQRAFSVSHGKVQEATLPESLFNELTRARTHLIERLAEHNDSLLERYLAGTELGEEELLSSLRSVVHQRRVLPLLCGSGGQDIGVHVLLDYILSCLPAPQERDLARPLEGHALGHPEVLQVRSCKAEDPFSARVIKTTVDPYFGKLSIIRVLSGTVRANQPLLNSSRNAKQKAGHAYLLQGKELTQVESLQAGQIGALAKLEATHTGDTLCEAEHAIVYNSVQFAEPTVLYAVEADPKTEEKVSVALQKLADEDPSLHFYRDEVTHQVILAGMGQTHIEVTLERLERKFGAHATLRTPKVPYRESIRSKAQAQGKLKKQTGGRGQFANVWVSVSPLPRGSGFQFVDEIVGGVIPKQYIPSVKKGIEEAMRKGGLAGYPVVDVQVALYDGSFHDVDSSDYAFQVAGSLGFKAAVAAAGPILLEPVMSMRIVVPEECAGMVIRDLSSRRAKILGLESRAMAKEVLAEVPLAEVLDYGQFLSGMTSGRGSFTMHTARYQEVPQGQQEELARHSEESRVGV